MPEGVSPAQAAAATDAVMTALHAVASPTEADIQKSDTVVLFGLGGLGMNALQTLLWIGPERIIVVDKRQECVDEAVKLGVLAEDAICNASDPTAVDQVITAKGILVDKVIDFVGVPGTFASTQNISILISPYPPPHADASLTRPGGTITLDLGHPQLILISIPAVMKNLTIHCSYSGTRADLEKCLELITQGVLTPAIQEHKLDNFLGVLKDLDAGKHTKRIVLVP